MLFCLAMEPASPLFPEVILSDFDYTDTPMTDEERMDTVSVCSERPPSVTIYPAVPVVTNSPTAANATTNVAASSAPSPTSNNLAGLVRPVPGSIPRRCPLCPSHHALYRCPTFRAMSFERRMRTVVSLGHCVNCLMMGHHARTCQSASRCAQCQ